MQALEIAVLLVVTWLLVLITLADFRPVEWLIERAKRTPYFHLDGYMERYWLVPYNKEIERKEAEYDEDGRQVGMIVVTDGTGPVTWRRPIAKLLQLRDVAARIHHILRSDRGRDAHDHPWPFVTLILRGGYWEERFDAFGTLISRKWHGHGLKGISGNHEKCRRPPCRPE